MEYTHHKGKLRRLVAVTQDHDTGEVFPDLTPTLHARTKKGAFVNYTKINSHELTTLNKLSASAYKTFIAMAAAAQANTIQATQAAIAQLAGTTQGTTSKSLTELQAVDLVRYELVNGLPLYRLSPHVVWRGANDKHRAAQVEWDKHKPKPSKPTLIAMPPNPTKQQTTA